MNKNLKNEAKRVFIQIVFINSDIFLFQKIVRKANVYVIPTDFFHSTKTNYKCVYRKQINQADLIFYF